MGEIIIGNAFFGVWGVWGIWYAIQNTVICAGFICIRLGRVTLVLASAVCVSGIRFIGICIISSNKYG